MTNGIFISYRRKYAHFAGRIHDYINAKGFKPFMDVYEMPQNDFINAICKKINDCPYFLLVLANDCLENLTNDSVFFQEMKTAFEIKAPERIIIVADNNFHLPETPDCLPKEVEALFSHHYDVISHQHFAEDMEHIIRNIRFENLGEIVWKDYLTHNAKTFVASRTIIEREYATLENRFGKQLLESVRNQKQYEGTNIVKQIRLSCFAATIIFAPSRDTVDDKSFDNGLMFNLFKELLRDPEFSLEIIINAPGSLGAEIACKNNMLGNRAREECPDAVFLDAYCGLYRLIQEVESFKNAYEQRRFRYYLSDKVMPGAIFQVEYKEGYTENDHIKYDIYNYELIAAMDRRSMLFFKSEDAENFNHLAADYEYLKRSRLKKEEIAQKHEEWMKEWEKIMEER